MLGRSELYEVSFARAFVSSDNTEKSWEKETLTSITIALASALKLKVYWGAIVSHDLHNSPILMLIRKGRLLY